MRAICVCLRAYGKSIYRFLNLSPPHQSGISFSSRTKRREPRSVSMQILPASAKSYIINSRQAPHGIPALPSGITATIFEIRLSPADIIEAIAARSAHIPSEQAVSIHTPE